jgi:hypothetical protein
MSQEAKQSLRTSTLRPDHSVRWVDELRLDPCRVLYDLDGLPGTKPLAYADAGGVAGGNLLVDLRPDRQNRQASFQQANPDHDFHAQELELRTNTELTGQIHLLTTELHRHILGQSAPDDHTPRGGVRSGEAAQD